MNQVTAIGSCTLHLGDCREILPSLITRGMAIVTDPPYGIGYVHGGHGQGIHAKVVAQRRDGRTMDRGSARNANMPIAGDDAPFDPAHLLACSVPTMMWGANHYASQLPPNSGPGWLCWDKSPEAKGPADNFTDAEFAWANFPLKRNVIRVLWKGVACDKRHEENGRRYHPTTKPQGVMLRCLQLLPPGVTGAIVDPYMGSGSTGVACVKLGRPFVGIELDPAHFAVACERLERAQRQGSMFIDEPAVANG